MMKKVFIVISNVLLSLFFVWVLTIWSDTYISYYHPNIAVFDSSPETNFQQVAEALDRLAYQTDSLIAIQSQDPNSEGKPVFSYMTFGRGELPSELLEKTYKEGENLSLETNYFIFEGDLDLQRLKKELSQFGLTNMYLSSPSQFSTLVLVVSNGFQLIGLLIFLLTFASLTLISQIGYLKTSGIRLISGERRWSIFLRPLVQDLKSIGVGLAVGGILTFILKFVFSLPSISLMTIVVGLIVYNLLLLLIDLFFAQLFAVGVKKVHLMQMIKGEIPVRGVISLILMGQLLAIIIISVGMGSGLNYSKAWEQQKQGQEAWIQEKDLISLSISREGIDVGGNNEDMQRKQEIWYQLVSQAVSEQKALLARHQLVDRVMQNGINSSKNLSLSTDWQDYGPSGNVLFVTPQYLKHQNISVDVAIDEKLQHLDIGEFVLLLPDFLRSEEGHYKSVFEEDVTNRMASKDSRQEMEATVGYLESGKDRFVYNSTPISYQQFLKDPIIVVVTPESTGEQSVLFWSDAIQGTSKNSYLLSPYFK
ncbi:bacteriocin-associated protein [Streptococcus danieliae]|nr:bacteriocin-associated protein [Streptococcus danieliae]